MPKEVKVPVCPKCKETNCCLVVQHVVEKIWDFAPGVKTERRDCDTQDYHARSPNSSLKFVCYKCNHVWYDNDKNHSIGTYVYPNLPRMG